MNKRLRILVLCVCGSVGVAIALAVAWRPKTPRAPDPTVAVLPSGNVPALVAATPVAATPPAPPRVEPESTPPAPAEVSLVKKNLQRMEETLDEIRGENIRNQRRVQQDLSDLQARVDRPVAATRQNDVVPSDLADDENEELPKPGTPNPIKSEGDGQLSFDWPDNTDIREALKLLNEEGLNILVSKNVTGTVSASLTKVDAETALAAILKNAGLIARREKGIIYVGTAKDFSDMDQSQDQEAMRIYRPNYVQSAELEKLITPLLTPTFGKVTVTSAAQVDIPSDQVKTGANDFAGTDMVVVKDYENVLRQIDELYAEVDIKPAQVAIEAMIINIKLNDSNQFGVNFQALRDNANARIVTGSNPITSLATFDVGNGGLKFGFLDSSLSTFILALETVGDTNVIASPRVLCMNKQRAEIQIGEQLGYVNTTVTQTASTQSVAFLDVGTLLRIRPFIANDGFIRMEVHPELSTGSVTISSGGQTIPNKTVSQVTSNVGCYDGSTIVIGGLLRKDLQTTTSQVPFIGNLPWVGPLFRTKTEKVGRDEIIVLITPRIVNEDTLSSEGQQYGNEFAHKQEVYFDKMSPIAKRNYALRYQRLALAAYNAGDHCRAIKQIDWSIHFDPMDRDAIKLRNEIVAAGGFEGESIPEYLNHARAPWNRPHVDYSKQGVPWKPGPEFGAEPTIQEEQNPGTPGRIKTISIKPAAKSP
jgi:type IV pilus assembly protein PilQ